MFNSIFVFFLNIYFGQIIDFAPIKWVLRDCWGVWLVCWGLFWVFRVSFGFFFFFWVVLGALCYTSGVIGLL
jgi:hypothetical protein